MAEPRPRRTPPDIMAVNAIRRMLRGQPIDPQHLTSHHFGDYLPQVEEIHDLLLQAYRGAENDPIVIAIMADEWTARQFDPAWKPLVTLVGLADLEDAARHNQSSQALTISPLSPLSPHLPISAWPTMEACAFTGLVGDFVEIIGPHSEADPVALLLEFLIAFGNVIGRQAHCVAEADYHAFNEYAVLVGTTSKGRKGSSWGHVRQIFRQAAADWVETRLQSGLSSGEGLIWAVRDGSPKKKKGEPPDLGIADKRLLVMETEFSSTLKVLAREGNTLSATMRNAWDNNGTLRTLTKSSPAQATGAHISIIGHITKDELLRRLDDTEAGNGFGNRFLWACVRRSKELPEGGAPDQHRLNELAQHLSQSVLFAKTQGTLRRDAQATRRWAEMYHELSAEKPGLMGAMIARAEAHVLRLSGVYAVMDLSNTITLAHLDSAYAVWRYCEASAQYIFGAALGDPIADTLLRFMRGSKDGVSRQEMNDHLGGHRSSAQIARALQKLSELGLAEWQQLQTGGRPVEMWRATYGNAEKAEKAE
jgi:hypothetical protein